MRRRRRRQRGGEPVAVQEWREWSSHQYDPGYWTAGKIPPFLKSKRLNGYGYVLVLIGFIGILMLSGPIARSGADLEVAIVPAALVLCSALVLIGTVNLVRHRS
jgi:hypothetical protein